MNVLDSLRKGVRTDSPEETQAWAMRLAKDLPTECMLALHGDLGVGKSTFVGGLARAWGIAQPVLSPTFNLYCLYEGQRRLIHLDAYRLDDPAQMESLMLEDFLRPPYCLAVEWPEHIEGWLPDDTWRMELSIEAPGRHHLRLLR